MVNVVVKKSIKSKRKAKMEVGNLVGVYHAVEFKKYYIFWKYDNQEIKWLLEQGKLDSRFLNGPDVNGNNDNDIIQWAA